MENGSPEYLGFNPDAWLKMKRLQCHEAVFPLCGVLLKSMQFDKTELNIIIKPVLFSQPNPSICFLQMYVASGCKIRRQG